MKNHGSHSWPFVPRPTSSLSACAIFGSRTYSQCGHFSGPPLLQTILIATCGGLRPFPRAKQIPWSEPLHLVFFLPYGFNVFCCELNPGPSCILPVPPTKLHPGTLPKIFSTQIHTLQFFKYSSKCCIHRLLYWESFPFLTHSECFPYSAFPPPYSFSSFLFGACD